MSEPGAEEAYEETRWAHELGKAVHELRLAHGWSADRLAEEAGMTGDDVARFEAGGTTPTVAMLTRFARALDAELRISVGPRHDVA